ncbi:MAG TPA: hypothetical protein DCZ40_13025 [Lachnospiraceae bacterium]|nr:hypothetical protein [Lachnospiraceae bacterium]
MKIRVRKKKRIRNRMGRIAAAAVIALLFSGCGYMGEETGENGGGYWQADYFAYVDEENKLYFWRQDGNGAVLLTDEAFAAGEKPEIPYWEEWEYWQEWDDDREGWVWNYEKAMEGIVKEAPDGSMYFPRRMNWKTLCMKRSAGEREEAVKYAEGEPVADYARVKVFLYDLYRYHESMEGEETGKIAENVCYYGIDKKGNVWYCRAEEDGIKEADGETYPFARYMLCRYDGEENLEIAEINGRRKGAFRVSWDGNYVIFYTLDDSLCGCSAGKNGEMRIETLIGDIDTDMFTECSIYTNEDMSRIIYAGDSIISVERGKEGEILGGGESLLAAMIGKEGDKIFKAFFEEEVPYADWVDWEKEKRDQDADKLKELMERKGYKSNPYLSLCHASVADLASQEEIQSMDGYLLSWPAEDGMSTPRDVYYIEMIPANPFEKFTLSELLGDNTPEDVLTYYEELKEEGYYEEIYGEEYEEHAFSDALDYYIDKDALEERAELYAVTAKGMRRIEEVDNKGWIINRNYSENSDALYFSVYWDIEPDDDRQSNRYYGYYGYGFLEDLYLLDKEGNCVKVAEAADETAVCGDEVFYSRITGMEEMVSLFRGSASGCVAEAVSVSMESIRKSGCSDAVLFLADGVAEKTDESGVHVESEKDLLKAYYDLAGGRGRYARGYGYGEETAERTLIWNDGNGSKILGEDIFRYGFYGTDNVWMLQYEDEEEGEGEAYEEDDWYSEGSSRKGGSRLYVYENGVKKQIAKGAVWMAEQERPKEAGYTEMRASWVYDR